MIFGFINSREVGSFCMNEFFCDGVTVYFNYLTHYTRKCKNAIFRVMMIMLHLCNQFTAKLLENKAPYT